VKRELILSKLSQRFAEKRSHLPPLPLRFKAQRNNGINPSPPLNTAGRQFRKSSQQYKKNANVLPFAFSLKKGACPLVFWDETQSTITFSLRTFYCLSCLCRIRLFRRLFPRTYLFCHPCDRKFRNGLVKKRSW